MGYRLSKIYTRTGDAGTTGLGDGSRVGKDAPRIAALGDVDELNAAIGVLLCEALPADVQELLTGVQHDLFDLGGELSVPGGSFLKDSQPGRLEAAIDRYNGELEPLKEFILPGGTRAAALTHHARTICRRRSPRRARRGRGSAQRIRVRCRAPVPEPAFRPALRPRPLAQQGRRQRRRTLAEGPQRLRL